MVRSKVEYVKRDPLTRPLVLAFCDWLHGGQVGVGDAHDFEMQDRHDELHVDRLIDAQTARAIADLSRDFEQRREHQQQNCNQAGSEGEAVCRKIEAAKAREPEIVEPDRSEEERRGVGPLGLVLALIVLYLMTLPGDLAAAMWSPLPPAGQWLLAGMIGAGLVVAAHWASATLVDLHLAWQARQSDGFLYREAQVKLGLGVVLPVAAIIATAAWREQGLIALAHATGLIVPSTSMNAALATLAVMAFAVAVIAGVEFRRAQPARLKRAARAKTAKVAAKIAAQVEDEVAGLEVLRAQADRSVAKTTQALTSLDEREQRRVEALRQWGKERKARVQQRAAKVELGFRRKHSEQGDVPPSLARRAGGSRSRAGHSSERRLATHDRTPRR